MTYLNNKLNSANYIAVKVTDSEETNGNNLLSTYLLAKTLTPNNNSLSSSNRLAIILPPAIYNLGQGFIELDVPYIDIIGSTNDRSKHYIKSNFNTPNYGVMIQYSNANDIKIINLTVENTTSTFILNQDNQDVSAYSPDDNLNLTYIENVEFKSDINHCYSMRTFGYYNGTYINVIAGDFSFGSKGGANGIFENCKGGDFSFGTSGQANGIFKNCYGGNRSFNL
jgi:hypothetical protein